MSEKSASNKSAAQPKETDKEKDEAAKVAAGREKNANPGFFLRSAVWLLSRFGPTKNRYQNWTPGRRILVGWVLWIVLLPIIPIVVAGLWYIRDPEGFKRSPWAKGLLALVVLWAGMFGIVATSPAQLDQNGKYSPVQTEADGETTGSVTEKPASQASEDAKQKVEKQSASKDSAGRTFDNCTEAFNAGVFDIKRSDSAYDNKLDRDDDGIACER